MPAIDDTNPGLRPPSGRRHAHFTLKEWGILVGIVSTAVVAAIFVMGLMYYGRSEGEALRSDFDHHCADNAKESAAQERVNTSLTTENKAVQRTMHRIELKIERSMPQWKRDNLPAHLRAPPDPDGD